MLDIASVTTPALRARLTAAAPRTPPPKKSIPIAVEEVHEEVALVQLYKALAPRDARLLLEMLIQTRDGHPLDKAAVDLAVAIGFSDAQPARDEKVNRLRAAIAEQHQKCKACSLRLPKRGTACEVH